MYTAQLVLLIDGDPDNLEICSSLLEFSGYRVITAPEPGAGVALARTARPAVVVTELFNRTQTGWEVLERLRSHPETIDVPIIAFTTRVMPEDRQRAAWATVYLTKPDSPRRVLEEVRLCCGAKACDPPAESPA